MDGEVAVEDVFGKRLQLIQPSLEHCLRVGESYIEEVEPTALELVRAAREAGWDLIILSGGFTKVIEPLARYLGIDHIEAVPLFFNIDGSYNGFDETYPTTRSGGKPEIINELKEDLKPQRIVMVGDGVSDLETQEYVDRFVGFGRFMARDRVKLKARYFVESLSAVIPLLDF